MEEGSGFFWKYCKRVSENTVIRLRSGDIITGIAGRKGFVVIRIEKDMMNQEVGFVLKVLQVLKDFNVNFEHLPSGIDTMCIVVSVQEIA